MGQVIAALRGIGVLRGALLGLAVLVCAGAPFAGGPERLEGLHILTTVVVPATFVVLLFVIPLDMTMTVVFMSDKAGEDRRRYRAILVIEAAMFVLLLATWAPFVMRLLRLV